MDTQNIHKRTLGVVDNVCNGAGSMGGGVELCIQGMHTTRDAWL